MADIFKELRRRSVFRVTGVYAVVGWFLVQVSVTLETALSLPAWFDGVVVSLLLVGFPIALILAWAFEITPEGMKRTQSAVPGDIIEGKDSHKLDYAILAGLGLVVLVIIVDRFIPGSTPSVDVNQEMSASAGGESGAQEEAGANPQSGDLSQQENGSGNGDAASSAPYTAINKSIAVLPFANRSPNPDDAFFAEGMHDDLLTRLSQVADMHVISRTSVMGFAGTKRKIPDIARELGVATIMEGAVQRAGNRVRINVQLIDAASDSHLWAEIYDRELTTENIFDIQSEITRAIAAALNSVLSADDEAALDAFPTQSLAAYDAYIRARGLLRPLFLNSEGVGDAIKAFDEAIASDPGFAAAYAGKAEAQLSMFWRLEPGNNTWLERARASIDRAQTLAPEGVETLIALGYYHYWGFLDYDRADAAIDRALIKAPNDANAWALKGYVARRAGRFDESINALVKAYSLDPLSGDIQWQLAQSFVKFGRFEEAQAIVGEARAVDPASERVFTADATVMIGMGEFERAWTMINETTPGSNWRSYYFFRIIVATLTRDPEKIRFALESFPEKHRIIPSYPETYAMIKATALSVLGLDEEVQALLSEIRVRINASDNPYPASWGANSPYFPVDLPGLMGDLAGVRAAVADFEANAAPDAFADLDRHYAIARAFEGAGDRDAAFEYLDKVSDVVGPSQYLSVKFEPAFDGMREDPRYLAMKVDYEAWAAARK